MTTNIYNTNSMKLNFLARLRKSKTSKGIATLLLLSFISEIITPTAALALTSGPYSPEFSSFEPVATTDMVNDFTGDFTYNLPVLSVPGPDGGGYSMSLSYHSGESAETEASWVGFGWTLNPGAINRSKRGIADDFNGATVTQYSKLKPNWTQTSGFDFNMEYNSQDDKKPDDSKGRLKDNKKSGDKFKINFGGINGIGAPDSEDTDNPFTYKPNITFQHNIRFNNYSGFSSSKGLSSGYNGMASLSMNNSGGETTMGFSVNPLAILANIKKQQGNKLKLEKKNTKIDENATCEDVEKLTEKIKSLDKDIKSKRRAERAIRLFASSYSIRTYNAPSVPYSVAYNAGNAFNYSVSLQIDPYGPLGFQAGIQGSMNYQVNYPSVDYKAYGYQHNRDYDDYAVNDEKTYKEASENDILQADFHIEKESTFNKHDKNLGIPYNSADIFSTTGNGVVGGFQFHHNKIGHFYPNFLQNKQRIHQLGLELGIGGTISIGFDVGLGFQKTTVGNWDQVKFFDTDGKEISGRNPNELEFDGSIPQMRFTNDLGGEVAYSGDDSNLYATVEVGGKKKLNLAGFINNNSDLIARGYSLKNQQQKDKDGKTSYIEYSVYNSSGILVNPLDLGNVISKSDNYSDLIGQIAITNKDGNKSVYGIPVFTKNETELSIGLRDYISENHADNDENLYVKNFELKYDNPLENYTVSGSRTEKPYASTYLLTQNTTSDYVDVDNNGPSENDFGGWTKFDYTCAYGESKNNWYRYRAPYTGLFYNRGRLNDLQDGTGSMSSGDKEVYYLKTIETKTHIAYFVTNNTVGSDFTNLEAATQRFLNGSNENRKDGYGAAKIAGGIDPAATGGKGNDKQQKLEKIVLFAKADMTKPISSTFFEYDYQLCKNTPNAENLGGRLTLKRVWTEGGGVTKTKIAPFQFEYAYYRYGTNSSDSKILEKYSDPNNTDITDVYSHLPIAQNLENPNYEPGQLDAWGNYQPNGAQRFKNMQPWLDQTKTERDFDPAAWQLKRIILPSGGEIHIQYEQKDYTYVEDQKATAMVDLLPIVSTSNYKKYGYKSGNDSKYYINSNTLKLASDEIDNYVAQLKYHFVDQHNKLYYKFLYSLRGESPPSLENFTDKKLNQKREYISGYISVNDVGYEQGKGIYLSLGDEEKIGKMDKNLPRWIGYKTFLTNGLFALPQNGSDVDDVAISDDRSMLVNAYEKNDFNETETEKDFKSLKKTARKLAFDNTFAYFGRWVAGNFHPPKKDDICHAQNYELSYFKVPVYHSKIGGGCRVKRLLSYDPGINGETGDAMVYGTEYIYKLAGSNLSSGVATFEPSSIREENALVTLMERKKQKNFDKLLNGKDSKTFEGPIGEGLYPSPSIGYSRVITKNIHSGKTTTGFAVNEYYTCKDFPMIKSYSDISKSNSTYKKLNLNLPLGLINIDINKAWVTQGYVFKLNDRHGKPIRMATYAGNYNANYDAQYVAKYDGLLGGVIPPTSETTYNYSSLGSSIKALAYDPDNSGQSPKFEISDLKLGQEEDLTMYRSKVSDITNNFSLEIDLNITLPLLISLGGAISYSFSESELSQHVTSKIIHESSFLLSTTSTVDGVTQTTENIAFNKYTGEPVLTRTYDGFTSENESMYAKNSDGSVGKKDGHYYSLTIPGSWIYNDLGQKYEDVNNKNILGLSVGSIVTYSKNELYDAIKSNAKNYSGDFSNVVSASTVILRKDWFITSNPWYDILKEEYGDLPSSLNSNYYPFRSYVYRDQTKDANVDYVYGGGVLKSSLSMFNWNDIAGTNNFEKNEIGKWFSGSKVLAYSPNGVGIAEEDILGINSIAKFNNNKTLPILTAQNAKYNQVYFVDYENKVNSINSKYAHTGRKSLDLFLNNGSPIIKNYDFNGLVGKGVALKVWLKSSLSEDPNSVNYGKKNVNPQLKASIAGQQFLFKRIAQTGEWSLFELELKDVSAISGMNNGINDIKLVYNFLPNELVLIDDFRIQPLDALMSCTVYKKDNKIEAQFDNQHFAVFFEYNNEGSLIRKSIETERGKKTLQEQHQNTPMIPR